MLNSKAKGGRFERECAKKLSIWMFDDGDVLKREPTSGAIKSVYVGDIFPMKQIDWKCFPFMIEAKTGYEKSTPSLYDYKILEKWAIKSIEDSECNEQQKIILLIVQFKQKPIFLFTDHFINENKLVYTISFPIIRNNDITYFYAYHFNSLLSIPFQEIFSPDLYK